MNWCESHLGWLAPQFLTTVDAGKPVTPFLGSWFDVAGKSQTGCYLGHQAIKELCQNRNLKDVALLENVAERLRPMVEEMVTLVDEEVEALGQCTAIPMWMEDNLRWMIMCKAVCRVPLVIAATGDCQPAEKECEVRIVCMNG